MQKEEFDLLGAKRPKTFLQREQELSRFKFWGSRCLPGQLRQQTLLYGR